MANIGTFTTQNGSYTGTVRTLTLNVKVRLVPSDKTSENAPDYRVVAGNLQTAWGETARVVVGRDIRHHTDFLDQLHRDHRRHRHLGAAGCVRHQ